MTMNWKAALVMKMSKTNEKLSDLIHNTVVDIQEQYIFFKVDEGDQAKLTSPW